MSTKKIIIRTGLAILIIAILAIAYFLIFVYFKPHVDYLKEAPDIEISAEQLFYHYVEDQNEAASLYSGLILLVEGVVDDIEYYDDMVVAVMTFEEGFFGPEGVRFTLLDGQEEYISIGDNTFIKGFCTGYTGADVIIEHASVNH